MKRLELIEKDIANWIKPYATIVGDNLSVDLKLREQNSSEYFLRLTQPNNFEAYAIALHSFYINIDIPEDKIILRDLSDIEYPEVNLSRISWKEFYERKGQNFNLNMAIFDNIEDWTPYNKQQNNEIYPEEGFIDKEYLLSLVEVVNDCYGNQEIELFYSNLATTNGEKDLIFSGRISELPTLLKNNKLRLICENTFSICENRLY